MVALYIPEAMSGNFGVEENFPRGLLADLSLLGLAISSLTGTSFGLLG
jgi:hypothetical protein